MSTEHEALKFARQRIARLEHEWHRALSRASVAEGENQSLHIQVIRAKDDCAELGRQLAETAKELAEMRQTINQAHATLDPFVQDYPAGSLSLSGRIRAAVRPYAPIEGGTR